MLVCRPVVSTENYGSYRVFIVVKEALILVVGGGEDLIRISDKIDEEHHAKKDEITERTHEYLTIVYSDRAEGGCAGLMSMGLLAGFAADTSVLEFRPGQPRLITNQGSWHALESSAMDVGCL